MSKSRDFSYQGAGNAAGFSVGVSVYADRPGMLSQICEDLTSAGFSLIQSSDFDALLDGEAARLGDVVIIDCLEATPARLAALMQLDMRVVSSGAQLIVSTSLDALDEVFACFDQSAPQFLVSPSRAERVVAIGQAFALTAGAKVHELSEEDRAALIQLSQQVELIARRIEGLSDHGEEDDGKDRYLRDTKPAFRGFSEGPSEEPLVEPGLPDARLVREIIHRRRARSRYFDSTLFSDPAWDMLLDLAAAETEHKQVSVTSLCIASGVPATTALRWIRQMTELGLFERVEDTQDRRRVFISLTAKSRRAMARYFAELGERSLAFAA